MHVEGRCTVFRGPFFRCFLPLLSSVASFCVGAVLLAAALLKAAQPGDTRESLAHVLPESGVIVQAAFWALVLAEILVGACLVTGLWRQRVLVAALLLCGGFMAWVGMLWLLDAPVPCGCGVSRLFGITGESRMASLVISGTMLAMCIGSIVLGKGPSFENGGKRSGVRNAACLEAS